MSIELMGRSPLIEIPNLFVSWQENRSVKTTLTMSVATEVETFGISKKGLRPVSPKDVVTSN